MTSVEYVDAGEAVDQVYEGQRRAERSHHRWGRRHYERILIPARSA